jgi:hypothetical protein
VHDAVYGGLRVNERRRRTAIVALVGVLAAASVMGVVVGTEGSPAASHSLASTTTMARRAVSNSSLHPSDLVATRAHSSGGVNGRSSPRSLQAYPRQVRMFKAFRDPAGATSQALQASATRLAALSAAEPHASEPQPGLLRTVYSSRDVTAGVFPTGRGLCFVAVVSGIGSSICTTTRSARAGLGLLLHTEGGYHVVGVLPDGAKAPVVTQASGEAATAPLSHQEGYAATTKTEPTAVMYASGSGTIQRITIRRNASSFRHSG